MAVCKQKNSERGKVAGWKKQLSETETPVSEEKWLIDSRTPVKEVGCQWTKRSCCYYVERQWKRAVKSKSFDSLRIVQKYWKTSTAVVHHSIVILPFFMMLIDDFSPSKTAMFVVQTLLRTNVSFERNFRMRTGMGKNENIDGHLFLYVLKTGIRFHASPPIGSVQYYINHVLFPLLQISHQLTP